MNIKTDLENSEPPSDDNEIDSAKGRSKGTGKDKLNLNAIKDRNLKKYRIIIMWIEGCNKAKIARHVGVDRKEVRRVIKKWEAHGSVELDLRERNGGRPPLFNDADKEEIKEILTGTDDTRVRTIAEVIKDRMKRSVSVATVSRIMNEMGRFCKPVWTPLLTPTHKEHRLQFCREHIEKGSLFQNVVFTDESRFYLSRATKKMFVLKGEPAPHKSKYNPDYSILVWGAICYRGKLYLEIIRGTLNHHVYLSILTRFMQHAPKLYQNEQWKFQQDGAPAHKTPPIYEFFEKNKILIHTHPANSPDLNPIELIWAKMKSDVELMKPRNRDDLLDAIFQAWRNLTLDFIQSCINHLPKYLPKIIDANGAYPYHN